MVKLVEVEDEHFTDKPTPSKNDALLVSDDDDDYSDTGKYSMVPTLFYLVVMEIAPSHCLQIRDGGSIYLSH